jgi:protoheme IX farnesyltransferase
MLAPQPVLAAPESSVLQRHSFAESTSWVDYLAITKPDVNVLILLTTATGFCLGSAAGFSGTVWLLLLQTFVGTVLVASGAAALNQWMERHFDARMRRTARRPIAAGRLDPFRALLFGVCLSLAGTAYLALAVNPVTSLLAVITLSSYLLLYTPFKRITPLCTLIGAFPGAMPPLIGWAAARGRLDPEAWVLFAIVFCWQFPHFMAIAWMYRDDYERAGYRVLARGPARARWVMLQTLAPVLALLPLSLLPLAGQSAMLHQLGVFFIGIVFACYALCFAIQRSGSSARQLLTASILYLPAQLALMLMMS